MPGKRILIVEDEYVISRMTGLTLKMLGYTVVGTTKTGEDAITMSSRLKAELILMDITLAGEMDGIEAAEVIIEEQQIPVVYITAQTDNEVLERAKRTKPAGIITKPFSDTVLKESIEKAFSKHSALDL